MYKRFISSSIVVSLLLCAACTKDETLGVGNSQDTKTFTINYDGATVLGSPITDPYSLSVMRVAFAQVENYGSVFPFSTVPATGLYIRALPQSEVEADTLECDSTIVWFDYPLDYEIVTHGCYYQDPLIPDSLWTWQYAVVPLGYNPPYQIYYEILDSVFIPDDYLEYENYERHFDLLEDYAIYLSDSIDGRDYINPLLVGDKTDRKSTKWTPSATITAWDDLADTYVPLEGVRVVAKQANSIKSSSKYTGSMVQQVTLRKK